MALQFLIALDQLVNTVVGGWADETLSARAFRCSPDKKHWKVTRVVIDGVFFWQKSHCRDAFASEYHRRHLPPAYRVNP
jgi:hypothetical protein